LQVDESFLKSGERELKTAPFEVGGVEMQVCLTKTGDELSAKLELKKGVSFCTDYTCIHMGLYFAFVSTKANRTIFSDFSNCRIFEWDTYRTGEHEFPLRLRPGCQAIRRRSLGYIKGGRFTVQLCADLFDKYGIGQLIVVNQDGDTFNVKWTLNEMDTLPNAGKSFAECALGSGILRLTFYPKGRELYGRKVGGAGVALSMTLEGRCVPVHATVTVRNHLSADKTVTKSGFYRLSGFPDLVSEDILQSNDSVHGTAGYISNGMFEMTFEIKPLDQDAMRGPEAGDGPSKKDYFGRGSPAQEGTNTCVLCERNLSNATIVHEENVYRECRIVCMDCGRDLQRQPKALCPKCNERFQRIF